MKGRIFLLLSLFICPVLTFSGNDRTENYGDGKVDGLENKELQTVVNKWLGTPYKMGGETRKGTDCSGFVRSVYKEVYDIELEHSSKLMSKNTRKVRKQRRLIEGDLVFFKIEGNRVSHVGIYLKDGLFVHASTQKGVIVTSLDEPYYKRTYYRGGRVAGVK